MSYFSLLMPPPLLALLSPHFDSKTIELALLFIACFFAWNILNLIVMYMPLPDSHLPRADMLDLRNRIVSIVHGAFSLFLSAYSICFDHSQCGEPNTPFEEQLMLFTCSYFLYDLLAMAWLGLLDSGMLLHHFICVSAFSTCIFTGLSANDVVGTLFVTEVSNPAMHLRTILRHMGMRYTKLYEASEFTYMGKESFE